MLMSPYKAACGMIINIDILNLIMKFCSLALTLRLRSSEPERILPLCTSMERTLETWPWSSLDSTSDPFGRRLKEKGAEATV